MIVVNIDKAKLIAHEIRRAKRSEEFAPLDEVIMKQLPGNDLAEAEQSRQDIRNKYDVIQLQIEYATSPEELKVILED
jgi:hypothetical protein